MGYTAFVTIGQNVGDCPMTVGSWESFKFEIAKTLSIYGGNIVQRPCYSNENDSFGTWQGEIEENAATFVALFVPHPDPKLASSLANIRQRYNQEAIGFVIVEGDEHFV